MLHLLTMENPTKSDHKMFFSTGFFIIKPLDTGDCFILFRHVKPIDLAKALCNRAELLDPKLLNMKSYLASNSL